MKKVLIILFLSLSLQACRKDEKSEIKNEDFSKTLNDIEYITRSRVNHDKNFMKNSLSHIDGNKNYKPRIKTVDENKLKSYLYKNINGNYKLKWIYQNFDKLDYIEKVLIGNDVDTCEFIYNKNNGITEFNLFNGQSIDLHRKTPYYVQWDNRWAYLPLGANGDIGISGCGPTSIAMIFSRLLNDKKINPKIISQDAQKFMTSEGILWDFFKYESDKYNLKIKNVDNNKKKIEKALNKGPLLVSVKSGYFTTLGHIIVIDSIKNDKLLINDPNPVKNSKIEWTYEEIANQISNIWLISKWFSLVDKKFIKWYY